MKYPLLFPFLALLLTCHVSAQERNIRMLNEVTSSVGVGSNVGGSGVPFIKLAYTGGVVLGEYFSSGFSVGLFNTAFSNELTVRGAIPFGKGAGVGAYASANGGALFAWNSSSRNLVTMPLASGSLGLFLRFKNGQRLYVGPSYIRIYQQVDDPRNNEKAWGSYLAMTVGYQF